MVRGSHINTLCPLTSEPLERQRVRQIDSIHQTNAEEVQLEDVIQVCANNGDLIPNQELDLLTKAWTVLHNHGSFLVEREPSQALCRHDKSKIREERGFMSSYLSRTPSLEEVGGRKGQIRTPWLMNVQISTMNRSHLHPLPSQQSIDQHLSTFFPPWHIKQMKFTHSTR